MSNIDSKKGIILAFHGFKQSPSRLQASSQLDDVANQLQCIIEYPKAQRLNWGGISPKVYSEEQLKDLDNVLDYLKNRYEDEWDGRLFLVGFSDGGNFAGTLARYWSSKKINISGIVVYAGTYQETPFIPKQNYPIIYIRGVKDPFVKESVEKEFVSQYYPQHDVKILRPNNGHKWNINVNPIIIEELQKYE